MNYPDGNPVVIGDLIWWNEGANAGRVAEIVNDAASLKEWGLEEHGIFITCNPDAEELTCDLFQPYKDFEDDGIGLKK